VNIWGVGRGGMEEKKDGYNSPVGKCGKGGGAKERKKGGNL